MTNGDIIGYITAAGVFLNAMTALASFVQSRRNGKDTKAISKNMASLEQNTNSKMDALVALTAKSSLAEGRQLERSENVKQDSHPNPHPEHRP